MQLKHRARAGGGDPPETHRVRAEGAQTDSTYGFPVELRRVANGLEVRGE